MTNFQIEREWWVERWLELLDSYRFRKSQKLCSGRQCPHH